MLTARQLCDPGALRPLLARHGVSLRHALGQNFLIADWVPQRIALESGVDSDTGVLEVGPGVGALTARLCDAAGRVTALELDRRLLPVLAETVGTRENLVIRQGDVLKTDLAALAEETLPLPRRAAVANLPYYITTPALTALLEAGCFQTLTVMVQREVAQRLCAAPGGKDYGAFTLYCQYRSVPELLFEVPPDCFFPAPKVTSAVVRLTVRSAPPVSCEDPQRLFRVIRAAFAQRRKTLKNGLLSAFPGLTAQAVADALAAQQLAPDIRGERLSMEQLARLSDALAGQGSGL